MTKKDYQNRIRVVLADKQITNRWLAEKMGVTEMTVSRWKTNKVQPSMPQFLENRPFASSRHQRPFGSCFRFYKADSIIQKAKT